MDYQTAEEASLVLTNTGNQVINMATSSTSNFGGGRETPEKNQLINNSHVLNKSLNRND